MLNNSSTNKLAEVAERICELRDIYGLSAEEMAERTRSEVVQVVGGSIVFYKENPDKDKEEKKKKPAKKGKPLSKVKAKRAAAAKREAEEKKKKKDFYAKKRVYGSKDKK